MSALQPARKPAPVWTAAPPTEPGLYYLTTARACCSEHPRRVVVREVVETFDGLFLIWRDHRTPVGYPTLLWGPKVELPEPPDRWPPA